MIGAANEVPPPPGAQPPVSSSGSESQVTNECPQGPLDANSATSGRSRTPSAGLPLTDCQLGFAYPWQVPLTTPVVDGVPVAHPLGPPLPPEMVRPSSALHTLPVPKVEGNLRKL